jgi:hypothetical protein
VPASAARPTRSGCAWIRVTCRSSPAATTVLSSAAWRCLTEYQGRSGHVSATIQGDPSKRKPRRATNASRSSLEISATDDREFPTRPVFTTDRGTDRR